MDIVSLIVTLLSGAAGGNIAGAVSKDTNLGTLGNTIAGALGGTGSSWIAQAIGLLGTAAAATGAASTTPELDIGALLGNVATSGVGGAAITAIAALIKNSMNK